VEIDRSPKTYLAPEDVDVVARQVTQLMTELWIVKDRMAVMEKLLEDAGITAPETIDQYVPEGTFADQLEHNRAAFVERVVGMAGDARTVDGLKQRSGAVRQREAQS